MNILLDPNIAYLILVLGFVVGILAVFIPGTGLLEVAALGLLVLAGWEMFQQPINYLALAVLLVGVFPFFIAVRRSGRVVYLVVCILALVLGSTFLISGEAWYIPAVNPFLALVVSALAASFLWLIARKGIEANQAPPRHNLGNLIGAEGDATTSIDPEGTVQIASELWSARSLQPIPKGSQVRVTGREGFILKVEKVEKAG